jgi:ABC-type glycerol-3-phosphate transport system substrate-binding protein
MLAYNREAFTKLGLNPETLGTWDNFIAAGKKVKKPGARYITEFSDSGVDQLMTILLQKGGGLFDADGNVTFDNDIAVETLLWYVPLVADKQDSQIASSLSSSFGQVMTQALEDEYFLTVVTPDWRSKQHETNVGKLSGKMGLMPLPTFPGNPRKTSTWGGTMLGITRKCSDKALAWEFAKFLYLNKEDLAERYSETYILPPVPDAWSEPAFDQAYAFYGGQRIGRDYATLALDVPPQYTSPFQDVAKGKFGQVLIAGVGQYSKSGSTGLRDFLKRELKSRADEVRKRIARNPF